MESIVVWFTNGLGQYVSKELIVFNISLLPILECRGGLLAAFLLDLPIVKAIPICVVGNILPIPFILFFIDRILEWMKKTKVFSPVAYWLEDKAMKKSDTIDKAEFLGLLLFVGIPLPGTGAWTGSLIAALLRIDRKKAIVAELLGVAMASVIVSIFSYGLLDVLLH
jgi:uncharacterized membrane protein